MGFGAVFAGLLFLMNPTVNIIDPLPDFIGCIIIYKALMKLSLMEPRIYEARKTVKWLALSSVSKMVAVVLVQLMCLTSLEKANALLLCTFSFAVIETWLIIKFFTSLYSGYSYLATRYSFNTVMDASAETKFFIIIFFVAKNILAFIPEFMNLFDPRITNQFSESVQSDIKRFVFSQNLTIMLCFVLGMAIFIPAVVYVRKFFRLCTRENGFSSALQKTFDAEIAPDERLWIKVNLNNAFALMPLAFFFLLNVYIDKVSIIPNFIFFFLAAAAVYFLNKIDGKTASGFMALSVMLLGSAVSLCAYIYRFYCVGKLAADFNILFRYQPLSAVLSAAEQVFIIASVALLGMRMVSALGFLRESSKEAAKPAAISLSIFTVFLSIFGFIGYAFPDLSAVYSAVGLIISIFWYINALKTVFSLSDELGWQYK
ncbi:MAG: hypothetical protein VB118_04545 [Oscillospiraceae bacterium]|nr:hypothetical protein [Oscillospiraceae bacterium]